MLVESSAYQNLDSIEKLLDKDSDFSVIPLKPLHAALKNYNVDQIALWLPKFSPEQRQAFLDIDLWERDQLSKEDFQLWIGIYGRCQDRSVISEFVQGDTFFLFLKAYFNIWTFDEENPEYPEHNDYFLTEDHLLLFEYDKEFALVSEVKFLLKILYSELGLEKAYSNLVECVTDSFSYFEERCYSEKKERLRDYGIIDYYEALFLYTDFPSEVAIQKFLKQKKGNTPEIDLLARNQILEHQVLKIFSKKGLSFANELANVTDLKRLDFLQFNFVRVMNAQMALEETGRKSSLKLQQASAIIQQYLELGLAYAGKLLKNNILDTLDFFDLYRIGRSLLMIKIKEIKNHMLSHEWTTDEAQQAFLGRFFESFLDLSFSRPTKVFVDSEVKDEIISNLDRLELWDSRKKLLADSLPFIDQFWKAFLKLKQEDLLQDDFYLNYSVDEIDYEGILISSLMNFANGQQKNTEEKKLGLQVREFLQFYQKYIGEDQVERFQASQNPELLKIIQKFQKTYGLDSISGFSGYMLQILGDQLLGYQFSELKD